MSSNNEQVDHPQRYNSNASGIECIDVVRHLNFNIGNAIKYIWRLGMKDDPIQELHKAIWYLANEIERISGKPYESKYKSKLSNGEK